MTDIKKKTLKVPMYFILIVQAIFTIYPILWMVNSSFKDNISFLADPWGIPDNINFDNYIRAWEQGIKDYLLNSTIITILGVIIVVILASMFSFMVARFPFKGAKALVGLFFAGMLIPIHCSLVPLYSMLNSVGLVNNLLALLLPYVAFAAPMAVFLTYGHFQQMPRELEESAFMDGCGIFRLFGVIYMPLAKSVISMVVILTSISMWNEFMYANILLSDSKKYTLPIGLMALKGSYVTDYAAISAALTISSLPIILIYITMSSKIQKGMVAGAVKG